MYMLNWLRELYPMFRSAWVDGKIKLSLYYCINNMIKKRQYPQFALPPRLHYGPLAVLKNIVNFENLQ
jgi:hypothetical protein